MIAANDPDRPGRHSLGDWRREAEQARDDKAAGVIGHAEASLNVFGLSSVAPRLAYPRGISPRLRRAPLGVVPPKLALITASTRAPMSTRPPPAPSLSIQAFEM